MADQLTITGAFISHLDPQTGTTKNGSPWVKRNFVMQGKGQYDKPFAVSAFGDKFEFLDSVNESEEITVHFNIEGREWQGKWFTSISAWKIEVGGNAAPKAQPAQQRQSATNPQPTSFNEPESSDLPF